MLIHAFRRGWNLRTRALKVCLLPPMDSSSTALEPCLLQAMLLIADSPKSMDSKWDRDAVLVDHEDVIDFNEANILPQPPETASKIRSWLCPTDYENEGSEYKKHLSSHLDGTGNWLLASRTYDRWHRSDNDGILWIRGMFQ